MVLAALLRTWAKDSKHLTFQLGIGWHPHFVWSILYQGQILLQQKGSNQTDIAMLQDEYCSAGVKIVAFGIPLASTPGHQLTNDRRTRLSRSLRKIYLGIPEKQESAVAIGLDCLIYKRNFANTQSAVDRLLLVVVDI